MSDSRYFKVPIPKGYRIFFHELEVAGAAYRRDSVHRVFDWKNVSIYIETEPKNQHDRNALKVIAFKKGFFGTKRMHIGYVPREDAKVIAECGLQHDLIARPRAIWIGDKGGLIVNIDLLGVKEDYHKLKKHQVKN